MMSRAFESNLKKNFLIASLHTSGNIERLSDSHNVFLFGRILCLICTKWTSKNSIFLRLMSWYTAQQIRDVTSSQWARSDIFLGRVQFIAGARAHNEGWSHLPCTWRLAEASAFPTLFSDTQVYVPSSSPRTWLRRRLLSPRISNLQTHL